MAKEAEKSPERIEINPELKAFMDQRGIPEHLQYAFAELILRGEPSGEAGKELLQLLDTDQKIQNAVEHAFAERTAILREAVRALKNPEIQVNALQGIGNILRDPTGEGQTGQKPGSANDNPDTPRISLEAMQAILIKHAVPAHFHAPFAEFLKNGEVAGPEGAAFIRALDTNKNMQAALDEAYREDEKDLTHLMKIVAERTRGADQKQPGLG